MGKYKVRLTGSRHVGDGTAAFYFEKPPGFEFVGGQSIGSTLIDPPETDAEGDTRAFSLASGPHEPYLMAANRSKSALEGHLSHQGE